MENETQFEMGTE